jgi:hypothetical protein
MIKNDFKNDKNLLKMIQNDLNYISIKGNDFQEIKKKRKKKKKKKDFRYFLVERSLEIFHHEKSII